MDLKFRENGQELYVEFKGELDHHTARDAKRKIERKFNNNRLKSIILDFNGLDFIDSSGIGFIIGRYKTVKNRQGIIEIINVNNKVQKMLKMSGIPKIINCK